MFETARYFQWERHMMKIVENALHIRGKGIQHGYRALFDPAFEIGEIEGNHAQSVTANRMFVGNDISRLH
ncbi:hypothetical protein D3C85_1806120 [compost metagenome]